MGEVAVRWATWMIVWTVAGCPKIGPSADDLALAAALDAADAAWAARGEGGLDAVADALARVPASRSEVPGVLWRLTRLEVARGIVADAPRDARRHHARGREHAMGCVRRSPGVSRALFSGTLAAVAPSIPPDRAPCAAWGGYAWARWFSTFDVDAASIDISSIDTLLARGRRDTEGETELIARWGQLLMNVQRPPDLGGDPLEARRALQAFARADRGDVWVRWGDVVRFVPDPIGRPPARPPATPEERAVQARLTQR